jgi:hypothetical protein
MNNNYQPLEGEKKSKPHQQSTLPAASSSSSVDPALLQWAQQKQLVQPGQDGTLPAMDRGGFGIQSMVWGGPMQTSEASVREKQEQRERRGLANAMKGTGDGEATMVGGSGVEDDGVNVKQERPRGRKRDALKRLFRDDAQQKRLSRMMEN